MVALLGIDVGTTNWKVAAFDEKGNLICIRKMPAKLHYNNKFKHGYYKPDEIWISIAKLIKQVIEEIPNSVVEAVSVTSMGEVTIFLNDKGEAIYPIIPWFDTRAIEYTEKLNEIVGTQKIFEITGLDNNPIFTLPKLMWLKDNETEVFANTSRFLSMADFIYYKLTREFVTDTTIACRTLMLDINQNKWSDELLDIVSINKKSLPQIYSSGTVIGNITKEAAMQTGLNEKTKIVTGGHDHPCGSLAAGILQGKSVLDSSGTAESIIGLTEPNKKAPQIFNGLRIGSYIDTKRYALWGGIIASGASIDWGMKNLASLENWGITDTKLNYKVVDKAIAQNIPGANGLIYLPHIRGCGAPYWNSKSKGAFIGLRSTHRQKDMMRAIMEGLCYEARIILEVMEKEMENSIEVIHTIGGGAKSKIWQQIKANITGKNVVVPKVKEATVMGAALLAGVGIGVYKDVYDATKQTFKVQTCYEPHHEKKNTYDELYSIYASIYPLLKDINGKLEKFL